VFRRVLAVLVAVLAIGSIAVGCGSSSDSSESSGPPLSKAAFVKQGDAICEKVPNRYQARLKTLPKEKKSQSPQAEKEEENLKAAVPPLRTATTELEGLNLPTKDAQQAEAIVAALEEGADGVKAKPSSELSGSKSPMANFQKLTEKYGFKVCSQL
jgi:hypothetical protein